MRLLTFVSCAILVSSVFTKETMVKVEGNQFVLDGQTYLIKGANYWQGMNLGAVESAGGNRTRLNEELDQLKAMGINNLRIMASSEGPDDQPYRMRPSLQPSPGKYNEDIFEGLDYFMNEIGKRNMTAVLTLSNFWHWSGGFSQYINWITNETIPYPVTDWDTFTTWTRRFYTNPDIREKANKLYKAHIRKVQTRRNKFNGKLYTEDPTVFSWQIANEPQLGPKDWYDEIAAFIKQGAPHQLVSSGCESKVDKEDFLNAHSSKHIDYATSHCWVENWGYYNASDPSKKSLKKAKAYAKDFISTRTEWANEINKPIVLEEFGMARDAWRKPNDPEYKYDPATPTSHKDDYYKGIFKQIEHLAHQGRHSGANFWAYGGLGRSTDKPNQYNMTWLGDPPHEPKGWYSVYNDDTTVKVIKDFTKKLQK
ncbi:hypothetical protein RMATCC62417_04322 [Rhizopus microsporus]|nr:hypothetical protein RMATCC62417_04322 [Rhizopus microsporus]